MLLRIDFRSGRPVYPELEGLGLIEMQPGRGYFLKEGHRPSRKDVRRKVVTAEIDQAIRRGPERDIIIQELRHLLSGREKPPPR